MRKTVWRILLVGCSFFVAMNMRGYGQAGAPADPSATAAAAETAAPRQTASAVKEGWFGVGVKASTEGGGVELAIPVARHFNVRGGFNMIRYSRTFDKDGVAYGGQLAFKTVESHFDIFPFAGGFHISPGVLAYIGDPITANATVAGGQSFSLGGTTYYSDAAVPITGRGKIDFRQVSPTATVGWGNLAPRNHKHFSIPFEIGASFQGTPKATLNLAGNVCAAPGVNCRSVASDPTVQSQILSEQTKLNNSMSLFKVYPIVSMGIGYKF